MFEPAAVALFAPKLITEWLLPPLLQLSNSILRVLLRTTLKALVWCIQQPACLISSNSPCCPGNPGWRGPHRLHLEGATRLVGAVQADLHPHTGPCHGRSLRQHLTDRLGAYIPGQVQVRHCKDPGSGGESNWNSSSNFMFMTSGSFSPALARWPPRWRPCYRWTFPSFDLSFEIVSWESSLVSSAYHTLTKTWFLMFLVQILLTHCK